MARIDFTTTPGEYTYTQGERGKHNYGVVKTGATSQRDPVAQRNAGGQDRQVGDHGGHLIPHSLGGRNDETNLDAQAANVNQIGQRHVERDVARLADDPNNTVFLDVQNYNQAGSERPDATMMTVAVRDNTTGKVDVAHYSFQNASYEEQAQWNELANQDVEIDPRQDIGMTQEERALANEYAEMDYSENLGEGYTMFFDENSAPITNESGNEVDGGESFDFGLDTGSVSSDDGGVSNDGGVDGGFGIE